MASSPFMGALGGAPAVARASRPAQIAAPTSVSAGATLDEIPYDQLAQLSKTMGSVIRSLLELQSQIQNSYAPDDWSTLLTQHMDLLSATHTLSSLLSSAAPTHDAQMASLNSFLAAEADSHNLYATNVAGSGAAGSNVSLASGTDALGLPIGEAGGSSEQKRHATAEGTPRVGYGDESRREGGNLLERIVVHPVIAIDAEKNATLANLLRTRLDLGLENAYEEAWVDWCARHPVAEEDGEQARAQNLDASTLEERARREARRRLKLARSEQRRHDDASIASLRAYWHLKQQPDENGEKYDWKMRISDEELREMVEAEEAEEAEAAEQEGEEGQEEENRMNVD